MSTCPTLPPELQFELQSCIYRIVKQLIEGPQSALGSEELSSPWNIDDALCAISLGAEAAIRAYARTHNSAVRINTLPPETLCQVLLAVAPEPSSWKMAHVCQHWRRVILADPLHAAYMTLRSSYTDAERMPAQLEYYLPRSKDGPTSIDLYVNSTGTTAGLGKVIDLHLYHLRQLFVQVDPIELHDLQYGLRAPAPLMEVAHICHYNRAVLYTPVVDLFSGYAPRLHTLRLHRVAVSVHCLTSFPNLRTLTYSAYDEITVAEIAVLLRVSPVLEHLTVGAGTFLVGGTAQPARFDRPEALRRLYFADYPATSSEPVRELVTAVSDWPLEALGLWTSAEESVKWLAESFPAPRSASLTSNSGLDFFLHISSVSTAEERAREAGDKVDSEGARSSPPPVRTRTARDLRSTHFASIMGIPGLISQLRDLTLSEVVLASIFVNEGLSFLPVAPLLLELTIELALHSEYWDAPRSSWKESCLGIFQLPLEPDAGWRCPALRVLTIAADPATSSPAIVSAHDIAVFLRWHLRAGGDDDKLSTLVLDGVTLYEAEGSTALAELNERVSNIQLRPHVQKTRPDPFSELKWVTPV